MLMAANLLPVCPETSGIVAYVIKMLRLLES